MDDGALPQRTRRTRRRRRVVVVGGGVGGGGSSGAATDATASSSDSPTPDTAAQAVRPIQVVAGCGYEYLDHTADVQVHSWGTSLPRAFEQAVVAMMAYMTDLETIDVREERRFFAEGHDLKSLLYNFMDECLYVFCTELMVCKQVEVESLELVSRNESSETVGSSSPGRLPEDELGQPAQRRRTGGGDDAGLAAALSAENVWRIRARGIGERFEMGRHPQGTEVKAITYSNMQIFDRAAGLATAAATATPVAAASISIDGNATGTDASACQPHVAGGGHTSSDGSALAGDTGHAAEIFVIVDI
eukprot:COSAG06_NODE_35_length_30757_cov_53.112532_4_plen_304_part_00